MAQEARPTLLIWYLPEERTGGTVGAEAERDIEVAEGGGAEVEAERTAVCPQGVTGDRREGVVIVGAHRHEEGGGRRRAEGEGNS